MFEVSVESRFWAGHRLDLPDGGKETAHNHNWAVAVTVSGSQLDKCNMLIDFVSLKEMVDNIVSELSGKQLEQVDYFIKNNATAEAVAMFVHEKLEIQIPDGLKLDAVQVVEEAGCRVIFSK